MKLKYYLLTATFFIIAGAYAQEEGDEFIKVESDDGKKKHSVTISNHGISINDDDKNKEDKDFRVSYFMIDLGFNTLIDNTNYKSAAAQNFIMYDTLAATLDKDVFSLRTGKSINVNIWPVMAKIRVVDTRGQKIFISTGVGLQLYNFRFTKNISYKDEPAARVIKDTISFRKNKLAFAYAALPLNFTFKTRLAEKAWLVYGFGVTGGYRLDSWTKQISTERGKDKNHDKFNFKDFNACVTGEFGISGYFRFYASYQVTPLHENALDQHPLCIGFRFGGI